MKKITPFLWFDGKAEEAMSFYVSVFKRSKVGNVARPGGPGTPAMSVSFELDGQEFIGLNGGPQFRFTEAVSMFVDCETQAEVDELWEKLSAGGEKGRCGWLKDRYGLSWQVIPSGMGKLLQGKDAASAKRVMEAMLGMGKIELAGLQRAYDGP
jgi:predicted 3-demethylubiquinone-9 3-methyltransferase (glyoxalase superfamily)